MTRTTPESASHPRAPTIPARGRALRLHAYGGPETVSIDSVETPVPGPGQVLVQVKAAGVNGLDWKAREGYVRDAFPLVLPVTLGLELADVVLQAEAGVGHLRPGDRVMGPLAGFGAYADFVAVDAGKLCLVPDGLSDMEAAALPVASLTAWQLLEAAGIALPDRRVLIHGAAGGVGGFAVQFAKSAGATVFATASARSRAHVLHLGADEVIDYAAGRFEEKVGDIDVVVDLIGGDVPDRSWSVLGPSGVMISTTTPDIAARTLPGRRGIWFVNRPNASRLHEIAEAVASGRLKSAIAETVGFGELPAAIERNRTGHAPGKIVVDLGR